MLPSSLLLFILPALTGAVEIVAHAKRTQNGLHLPVYRREAPSLELERRAGASASSIGLGNFRDITYNVLIQVGETAMPLVLDTGSSDLWAISDACTDAECKNGLPVYPQATFKPNGVDAQLFYGDSLTGTHAFGEIGTDSVGLAGLVIPNQLFAAINQTNTTVPATQSSGIFGLGFPVNSVIWNQMFRDQFPLDNPAVAKRTESNLRMSKFPDLKGMLGGARKRMMNAMREVPHLPDYRITAFPDLRSLLPSSSSLSRRKTLASSNPTLTDLLSTFDTNGPLMSRLAQSQLASPEFTVTLQRDTIDIGGNVGMLSLGELPQGVSNDSLTWVGIRGYTASQGGIDSPTDVYPIAWEVPIDDVFVDGKRLPQSLLSPGISVTALVDTGNSLIRGPADVVQALMTQVTGSTTATTYDCSVPHTIAFQIGGKMFPIDPRDFMRPVAGSTQCQANVVSTDPPKDGFLYSWSLGDPFLKSVLASFYFGNLTHPSVDAPRMGFLSTVPTDATTQFNAAISSVQAVNNGVYPSA
ncbi:hypothetical protein M422DRAFT_57662 [Sphaerobolus stellatus SS14]|nr:hypothetical protein M422DRAFT_57662 [Sphaerobolus stellatus SS14]